MVGILPELNKILIKWMKLANCLVCDSFSLSGKISVNQFATHPQFVNSVMKLMILSSLLQRQYLFSFGFELNCGVWFCVLSELMVVSKDNAT